MIRKALLSLLLIAAGLGVLHLVIGFENFASVDEGPGDEPIQRTRDERGVGGGVKLGGGGGDDQEPAVWISGSGRLEIGPTEEVELPDGVRIPLPIYDLVAEDTETVSENLWRLDRVTVRVYRIERHATPPRSVLIGTITARQAFVELGRDEKGAPSIREDREMDLREVVLSSTPDARLSGLRLEVSRLNTRQTQSGIEFRTPTPDVPFTLVLGGEEPTSPRGDGLRGDGLRGVLPSKELEAGAPLEFHVSANPVLVRGSTTLRAKGPLDYIEDLTTGVGRVEVREAVQVLGIPGSGGPATTASGDTLVGQLVRSRADRRSDDGEGGSQRATWQSLVLKGEPATLSDASIELSCTTLLVLPALGGGPAAFVADGEPELRELPSDRRPGLWFRAERRIHVVDLPRFLEPLHAPFGYPRPDFGALVGRLVVFEGASRIVDASRDLEIDASDGLRVAQSIAGSGPTLIVGNGTVALRGQGLQVDAANGFELRRLGSAQTVRLGPRQVDPAHAFSVTRDLPDGRLVVRGTGSCRFSTLADGSTRIDVDSPTQDLVLERGRDALRGVRELRGELTSNGGLRDVHALGDACIVESDLPGPAGAAPRPIRSVARSIDTPDGRSFYLTGDAEHPVTIDRGVEGHVAGRRVEIHRLAGARTLFVAHGTPAVARIRVPNAAREQMVELRAGTLRFVPGLVPPGVLAWNGIPPGASLARRLVLADGAVEVDVIEADGTVSTHAAGDALALRLEDKLGRLRGEPAMIDSVADDGRRLIARSREVRFRGTDPASQRVTLVPIEDSWPELDLLGTGESAFDRLRISCGVPIVADADGVRIDGPVHVRGLDAAGDADPGGVALDADAMTLTSSGEPRTIQRVAARGAARFRYRDIQALGDEMRVDVANTRVDVEGRPSVVELRGFRVTGRLFRVDYAAQEFRAWGPLEGVGRTP